MIPAAEITLKVFSLLLAVNDSMCITRVGKVLSLDKSKATVKLLGDNKIVDNIDVSMVEAGLNSFVEVYANLALGVLTTKEANRRKRAWVEVMRSRN